MSKMDDSVLALERAVLSLSNGEEDSSEDEHAAPCGGFSQQYGTKRESNTTNGSSNGLQLSSRKIFEDPDAFLQFRRFLKEQCVTRNLNFWLACQHYSQLPGGNLQQLMQIAKAIYHKFVKNSAPQHVSVNERTKNQIKASLELKTVTPDLFGIAQVEIWQVMEKNEIRQFLSSDACADCSAFSNKERLGAVFTPVPPYGGCGGGSLQHSSSEDSASITSFSTDSEAGPGPSRSMFGVLSRPFPSAVRNAKSDTEGSKRPHPILTGPHLAKDQPITQESFIAMVMDRLLAVTKDREMMKRRAQDQARQQGKTYDEIMAIEWYELPEAVKYIHTEDGNPCLEASLTPDIAAVSHCRSPSLSDTPSLPNPMAYVNTFAQREVQDALKDLEITKQVSKRHGFGYKTSTDSGVGGDPWGTVDQISRHMSPNEERLQAYLKKQNHLTKTMPEREMQAQAAAIVLISNSPHPETLNPHVPMSIAQPQERNRPPAYMRPYHNHSSDDSSSCITMTSMSNASSDLFIPRRVAPHNTGSVYSDQDDHSIHHISRPHRNRQMAAPTRRHPNSRPSSTQPSDPTMNLHNPTPPTTVSEGVLVVYHIGDLTTPYAKRVNTSEVTLGQFKEKIFVKNPGEYRYFFQTYCPDLGSEVLEEYTEDTQVLPVSRGKVMGRVEKIM